jgi:hypothetical protein
MLTTNTMMIPPWVKKAADAKCFQARKANLIDYTEVDDGANALMDHKDR